jgi:Mlc titration factor MtfA (ptsG expression regulator)
MTTLREQAQEAVDAASFEMHDGDGASGVVYPSVAADAASDVWEPVVEDQKATILSLCDVIDNLLNVISAQAAPDIVAHAVANANRVRQLDRTETF